jgi:hypothetical protein
VHRPIQVVPDALHMPNALVVLSPFVEPPRGASSAMNSLGLEGKQSPDIDKVGEKLING